ncbi:hypothetical protein PR202_ga01853 [Eleusine coracana subsp. coracana]|uniref:Uncharacterized protein n=1 Tax=Eleusine coracana subsp. coracana TaxID=191504 RepID=A0AAV5BK02_ELECO|nr:hypothetical protein PR202_ga01166 [Eleusine coracana subsp. coracana]GJM86035.1 hypothetical protein PR202_ga01853 [Eleusine coracana subsp. coracana]
MAKKRKHTEASAQEAAAEKPDDSAPTRPERTLFGFKKPAAPAPDAETASAVACPGAPPFRNKEKVLVTCSRRITFR